MAYIEYGDDRPDDVLSELLRKYNDPKIGQVDNILRIHSHNPRAMRAHFDLYKNVMRGKSELSFAQREMIAVVVSRVNDCHY